MAGTVFCFCWSWEKDSFTRIEPISETSYKAFKSDGTVMKGVVSGNGRIYEERAPDGTTIRYEFRNRLTLVISGSTPNPGGSADTFEFEYQRSS